MGCPWIVQWAAHGPRVADAPGIAHVVHCLSIDCPRAAPFMDCARTVRGLPMDCQWTVHGRTM
eukprot:10621141-Lingulodinium_polyedra.AAC.1